MTRIEFIRLGLLSLVVVGSGCTIVPDKEERSVKQSRQKWCVSFKVSNELLRDKEQFKILINEVFKNTKPPKGYKLDSFEIGMAGGDEFTQPDFVLNLFTVLLTYR